MRHRVCQRKAPKARIDEILDAIEAKLGQAHYFFDVLGGQQNAGQFVNDLEDTVISIGLELGGMGDDVIEVRSQ